MTMGRLKSLQELRLGGNDLTYPPVEVIASAAGMDVPTFERRSRISTGDLLRMSSRPSLVSPEKAWRDSVVSPHLQDRRSMKASVKGWKNEWASDCSN